MGVLADLELLNRGQKSGQELQGCFLKNGDFSHRPPGGGVSGKKGKPRKLLPAILKTGVQTSWGLNFGTPGRATPPWMSRDFRDSAPWGFREISGETWSCVSRPFAWQVFCKFLQNFLHFYAAGLGFSAKIAQNERFWPILAQNRPKNSDSVYHPGLKFLKISALDGRLRHCFWAKI